MGDDAKGYFGLRNLTRENFTYADGSIQRLHRRAIENGYPDTYDDQLYFYAAAAQARVKSDNPPALFIWLLKIGTRDNVSDDALYRAKEVVLQNKRHFDEGLVKHVADHLRVEPNTRSA